MSHLGNFKVNTRETQGVDVLRKQEQERRARLQLYDDPLREPPPVFGQPVKVDEEDETARRIKNTLGDFTQVLYNDPKHLIGISRLPQHSSYQTIPARNPRKKSLNIKHDPSIPVETILKEMTKVVPLAPLTAIQTPRTEDRGAFPFPKEIVEIDDEEDEIEFFTPFAKPIDVVDIDSTPSHELIDDAPFTIEKRSPKCSAANNSSTENYKCPTLQDDLEMSESDDEAHSQDEKKKVTEENLTTITESASSIASTEASSKKMEEKTAESSNSSSSESDSDDSSSESNDSDSSSAPSEKEISSKKWGLSNFLDESQRRSPALPMDKNAAIFNPFPGNAYQGCEKPPKQEIISPLSSPFHPTVGPRTPPELKEETEPIKNETDKCRMQLRSNSVKDENESFREDATKNEKSSSKIDIDTSEKRSSASITTAKKKTSQKTEPKHLRTCRRLSETKKSKPDQKTANQIDDKKQKNVKSSFNAFEKLPRKNKTSKTTSNFNSTKKTELKKRNKFAIENFLQNPENPTESISKKFLKKSAMTSPISAKRCSRDDTPINDSPRLEASFKLACKANETDKKNTKNKSSYKNGKILRRSTRRASSTTTEPSPIQKLKNSRFEKPVGHVSPVSQRPSSFTPLTIIVSIPLNLISRIPVYGQRQCKGTFFKERNKMTKTKSCLSNSVRRTCSKRSSKNEKYSSKNFTYSSNSPKKDLTCENKSTKKRKSEDEITVKKRKTVSIKKEEREVFFDESKSNPFERRDSLNSNELSQRSIKLYKDKNSSTVDSKIKTAKEIKQEKCDRPKKEKLSDKMKSKSRKKTVYSICDDKNSEFDLLSSSQYSDDINQSFPKGKRYKQSLMEIRNSDWDNFAAPIEIQNQLKEAAASLNKPNKPAPILPMDYYWTEGWKQQENAQNETDPFQQAVKFLEAAVLFILTSQQREEFGKDNYPESERLSAYFFYNETLKFSDKVLSRVKKSSPGSTEFKLLILCLKCQSLLHVKLYSLKIKELKEELDGVTEFLSVSSTSLNVDSDKCVSVPQAMLDMIYSQHTHLLNLHRGHALWVEADMYITRSNLREFFKEVADQSEPLTLHSSIPDLVKYVQKAISLIKKSFLFISCCPSFTYMKMFFFEILIFIT